MKSVARTHPINFRCVSLRMQLQVGSCVSFCPHQPFATWYTILAASLRGCLTFELLSVGRTLVMGINISYDMEAFARCISDLVTLPVEP